METVNNNHRFSATGAIYVLTGSVAALALAAALVGQTANAADSAETSGDIVSTQQGSIADPDCEETDLIDCLGPDESSTIGARASSDDNNDMSSDAFDEAAPYDDLVEQGSRPAD